jgi:hypothetical protein
MVKQCTYLLGWWLVDWVKNYIYIYPVFLELVALPSIYWRSTNHQPRLIIVTPFFNPYVQLCSLESIYGFSKIRSYMDIF